MYRVLIADGSKKERRAIRNFLKKNYKADCELYEAADGSTALACFQRNDIQIVILETDMADMNGFRAAEEMRKQNEDCCLIFLSSYADFSCAKRALSMQAVDYLVRPIREEELGVAAARAFSKWIRHGSLEKSGMPRKESGMPQNEPDRAEVKLWLLKEQLEQYVREHYAEDLSVHELAGLSNYSEAYFSKMFKECFHTNFTSYLVEYRIRIAKEQLENSGLSVKEIGRMCGYADSNYFARIFKREVGITPSEYRHQIMLKKRC